MSPTIARRRNPRLSAYAATPLADINVTPLIDVLLVLLMVFMLAAPILAHRVVLDLPQAAPPKSPTPPRMVKLLLRADGSLTYDDTPLPAIALDPQLRADLHQDPDLLVNVDADPAAHYEDYARTIATMKTVGVHSIGVARLPSR